MNKCFYFIHKLFFTIHLSQKLLLFTDILSFAISDLSDTFIEVMNQDEISFKSQFILESLVKKDPGFTFNLAHDSDNKVTGIVWMICTCVIISKDFGNIHQSISINSM